MSTPVRKVMIRVDSDAIEVSGHRMRRPVTERHGVQDSEDRFDVLEAVLATSPLLRPGRRCDVGVIVESPHILYRTIDGEGDAHAGDGELEVVMPAFVRDVLDPILARRRVHGTAWFAGGPARRALLTLRARAATGSIGRGFIIDRSSAAVTVLLVDGPDIRWARGAPADEPADVAAHLLRRAAEVVNGAYGLHWWHIEDVSSPEDVRTRRRESRELEARCHSLIGYLPRMATRAA